MSENYASNMKDITPSKYLHMLWKDETGEKFLLLKYAEVYMYSKDVLRLHLFSYKYLLLLRKKGFVLNEKHLNEPFYIVDVDISNLEAIIQLGVFKRRPDINGVWVKDKEQLLAHKIIPYKPNLELE